MKPRYRYDYCDGIWRPSHRPPEGFPRILFTAHTARSLLKVWGRG